MGVAGLDFRILGPLEVWQGDERVPVEASRERAILAVLLLGANRVVAADRLTELVWGDDPPPRARNTVHTLVWRLRRRLASAGSPEVLLTQPPGYLVRIEPDQLDLHRFERLLDAGREAMTAGRVAEAERLFGDALGLWRGQPLADVAAEGLRRLEEPRLEELQLQAVEARVEAQLALGRHGELIGELRGLVADHRLREALSGHLMVALYRSGRQAEALETYRSLRAVLAEELGVEPGSALQRLHQAVLRADPALDRPGTADRALDLPGTAGTAEPAPGPPAPARLTGPVPALLPADIPAFTGRVRELRDLDDLLDGGEGRPAAVVITAIAGTAGVGKTALAVRWAHRVRDRFADGQLYVNLRGYAASAPMRPIDALSRFLRALGVPAEQVPHELEEAADLYRSLLADRRVLVILDHARGPDQVRPLLPGGSGCLVLITSRDRLGGLVAHEGAHRLTLDVLPPDEAHTLLARVVGAERVAAEPAAAEDLARACAHLPLALRIAGANLINHPQHRLADYLGELRDGNRLASLEVDGDEQAAVRNNFDLSYTGLPAPAQRLFRLLGLVPGPDVTAGAAAALADVPPQLAARELDRLAGAHLISESAPARYAFHDLLRLYAAEHARLEESDADL
ncbi:MAG TPA: BTAD domain-containing putative transcriptional regulator, partial [Pilimelia sp.]|nr:BTAD domain-containing putative transcriptional regulator [Pilimelia sp.]